jgi:hypothetical protein
VPVFLGRHKVKIPGGEVIVELSKSETRKQVNLQAQQTPAGDVLEAAPEE